MFGQICPSRKILEIGVNSAVISFNDGNLAVQKVFKSAGVHVGRFMVSGLRERDQKRMSAMGIKSSQKGLKRRKKT